MTHAHRRMVFRFHLITLLLWSIVAGGFLMLNAKLNYKLKTWIGNMPGRKVMVAEDETWRGWPWRAKWNGGGTMKDVAKLKAMNIENEQQFAAWYSSIFKPEDVTLFIWDTTGVLADLAVFLAAMVFVGVASEYLLRRRTVRHAATDDVSAV